MSKYGLTINNMFGETIDTTKPNSEFIRSGGIIKSIPLYWPQNGTEQINTYTVKHPLLATHKGYYLVDKHRRQNAWFPSKESGNSIYINYERLPYRTDNSRYNSPDIFEIKVTFSGDTATIKVRIRASRNFRTWYWPEGMVLIGVIL